MCCLSKAIRHLKSVDIAENAMALPLGWAGAGAAKRPAPSKIRDPEFWCAHGSPCLVESPYPEELQNMEYRAMPLRVEQAACCTTAAISCSTATKSSEDKDVALAQLDLGEDGSVQKARDYIVQAVGFYEEGLYEKAAMRLRFATGIMKLFSSTVPAIERLQRACLQDAKLQTTIRHLVKDGHVDLSALIESGISQEAEEVDKTSVVSEVSLELEKMSGSDSEGKGYFEEDDESDPGAGCVTKSASLVADQKMAKHHDSGKVTLTSGAQADKMHSILDACKSGKLLEAHRHLRELLRSTNIPESYIEDHESPGLKLKGVPTAKTNALNAFLQDPVVQSLKDFRIYLNVALEHQKNAPTLDNTGWMYTQATESSLGNEYLLEFWIRRAKGEERIETGPATQLTWYLRHWNLPIRLTDMVSVYREVDLFNKSWIPGCKQFEAAKSDLQSLNATCVSTNTSDLMSYEDVVVQNMFIWREASSVVILGRSPPHGARMFEGFDVTPRKRGTAYMPSHIRSTYISPHPTKQGVCNIVMSGRRGLILPEWLVSSVMMKHIIARSQLTQVVNMLLGFSKKRETYKRRQRAAGDARFYAEVSSMESEVMKSKSHSFEE